MIIRPAKISETGQIKFLAEKFNLDSENMPASEFMVAEENKKIIGFGRIIRHPGSSELCSIGVLKSKQKQGIGSALVSELIKKAGARNLYLATIIPSFFEKFGFKKTLSYPESMKKKASWCEGCYREKCVVMKYKRSRISKI